MMPPISAHRVSCGSPGSTPLSRRSRANRFGSAAAIRIVRFARSCARLRLILAWSSAMMRPVRLYSSLSASVRTWPRSIRSITACLSLCARRNLSSCAPVRGPSCGSLSSSSTASLTRIAAVVASRVALTNARSISSIRPAVAIVRISVAEMRSSAPSAVHSAAVCLLRSVRFVASRRRFGCLITCVPARRGRATRDAGGSHT